MESQAFLIDLVEQALASFNIQHARVQLERPAQFEHGDFSTNVALVTAKAEKLSPRDLATKVVQHIQAQNSKYLEKIEVAGPGFINFYLSKKYFSEMVLDIQKNPEKCGFPLEKKKKSILIEHTQPNTNKPMHVGHLRNAVLGMSLVHLLGHQYVGVESTNINNDRGIANIKGMWAYLRMGRRNGNEVLNSSLFNASWGQVLSEYLQKPSDWKSPQDLTDTKHAGRGDFFVGHYYVLADRAGEDERLSEQVKKDWAEMLQAWENADAPAHADVLQLWKVMNDWFYAGSATTKTLLGVRFTLPEEYESELYQKGKVLIEQALASGVSGFVRLADGAIQVELTKTHALPDKILVRRDGTAIYMTFDIELTRKRIQQLHADECIWVVGSDQDLHFKQLFAICELLGLVKQGQVLKHFSYGMVRLPEGKLSSRKGLVVYADDILELAIERAREVMRSNMDKLQLELPEQEDVAKKVGVGAVKWAMLKVDPKSDITFDLERSVSLEGNSGPYVQYAYARACSVLRKAEDLDYSGAVEMSANSVYDLERVLAQFPVVMRRAINDLAPHDVCTYLFELAQAFNSFYAENPILGSGSEEQYRLLLTQAVATTIRNGLGSLGIDVVERM